VGEDGGLIAGHARILAARQLGIAEIPVMVAAGWSEARRSVRFFIAARRPSRCLLYGRRGTACGMLRIAYLHGVEDAVLQQAGPIISPSRNLPFFTRLHSAPWPSQLNNCGSPDIDSTQGVSATCVGTQKCD
jgi:hypothetical protein